VILEGIQAHEREDVLMEESEELASKGYMGTAREIY